MEYSLEIQYKMIKKFLNSTELCVIGYSKTNYIYCFVMGRADMLLNNQIREKTFISGSSTDVNGHVILRSFGPACRVLIYHVVNEPIESNHLQSVLFATCNVFSLSKQIHSPPVCTNIKS